jgi:hypothetical protein
MPSIHDGHRVAAKVPCWKPAFHSGDQVRVFAVAPLSASLRARSHAVFTAGLLSATTLKSLS